MALSMLRRHPCWSIHPFDYLAGGIGSGDVIPFGAHTYALTG
jgi:hypothetical protein